jgi:hypothetical protein
MISQPTIEPNGKVLDPARINRNPVSPNETKSTMMGLFVGLLIPVGIFFLRRLFDTKVKYYSDIVSVTNVPFLCEIPAREMHEFRMMCNPEVELRKYVSEQEAKLKAGTPVVVKYGPLKGLSGKLVRSNKKYYLLKEVPGLGVMLKVSRWCCVALPSEQ